MRMWLFFFNCFLGAMQVSAQAVVEHSVITGAGATATAAGSKGAGQSIGGVFRSLSETLEKAAPATQAVKGTPAAKPVSQAAVSSPAARAPVPSKKASEPPAAAAKLIDPALVTEGLDRAELIDRFGDPVLQMSETRNSQLVERLWYNVTRSNQVEIRLIDGKVAAVLPPANKQ